MAFHDHFSGVAGRYAASRPTYPEALFDWLASIVPSRTLAWDAATGNGQAAVALAERFGRVVATDASADQIAHAKPHPRVSYAVAKSEEPPAEAHGASLVTVAQALHWFDFDAFHAAVRRVVAPGGVLAVWSYAHHATGDAAVDAVVRAFNARLLADGLWPRERRWVDEGYRTIPFPFQEIEAPPFEMTVIWDAAALAAYVETWSAVQALRKAGRGAEAEAFQRDLLTAWGDPAAPRRVAWPLVVRVGR